MAFETPTWYIGWLGEMRAFPYVPEVDFTVTEERMGDVHQGLNGARTMDHFGTRGRYSMEIDYLTPDDITWLRALYTQLIPGPHYLINPFYKNLLSLQASNVYAHGIDDLGLYFHPLLNREFANDFPSGPTILTGSRCIKATTSSATNTYIRFDGTTKFIPWNAGETLTWSVYMKADANITVNMLADTVNKYGVDTGGAGAFAKSVTTSWTRFSITVTQSGTHAGFRPALLFPTSGAQNVYIACPQVEYAGSATAWRMGGGSQKVVIDDISTSSPRYPLFNANLSILEA